MLFWLLHRLCIHFFVLNVDGSHTLSLQSKYAKSWITPPPPPLDILFRTHCVPLCFAYPRQPLTLLSMDIQVPLSHREKCCFRMKVYTALCVLLCPSKTFLLRGPIAWPLETCTTKQYFRCLASQTTGTPYQMGVPGTRGINLSHPEKVVRLLFPS